MKAKEFYEHMYGDERQDIPKLPFLYRKLRRFELNRYDLIDKFTPGGDTLLDIGCGDGELLMQLRNKYKEVWGIDIAESRINRIQKKIGNYPGIHVQVADANESLSFPDGSFNTIIIVAVLEHIFNPFHLIKECSRLLYQGGSLMIHVPNVARLSNRIRLLMGMLPVTSDEDGWDGGHLHYFTRSSLKRLLEWGRFRVVKITSGGIFAKPRRIWGSLLGSDILIAGIK